MSRRQIGIILAVIAGVILLCACAGTIGYLALNTPLGPALKSNTPVVFPTTVITSVAATPKPLLPTLTPSATPGLTANCGATGSMNILIMGVDSPFSDSFKGPLAIRLVKLDFSQKKATVQLVMPIRQ